MIQLPSAIAPTLEPIIGTSGISEPDTNCQSAVTPETQIDCIASPNAQEELAEVIACAYRNRWQVLPTGNGSKLGWGGVVQTDPPNPPYKGGQRNTLPPSQGGRGGSSSSVPNALTA